MTSKERDNASVDRPEPYYTNEDVAILHDIVVHAQALLPALPEQERLPTNALFNVYYATLPSIGVDADHDSRYARILFKIGGMRGGGSLYEKFEAILSRMDIEIQFEPETDNEHYEESPSGFQPHRDAQYRSAAQLARPVKELRNGHRRRNSESSVWDFGVEPERTGTRSRSMVFTSSPDPAVLNRSRSDHFITSGKDAPKAGRIFASAAVERSQWDRDVGAWLKLGKAYDSNESRDIPTSIHQSTRLQRPLHFDDNHNRTEDSALAASVDNRSIRYMNNGIAGAGVQSSSRMERAGWFTSSSKAFADSRLTLIRQRGVQKSALRLYQLWLQKTLKQKQKNANLSLSARHRDRQILLRQAFDTWRTVLQEYHQQVETERFFAHLGRRTNRARDLYLLAKAFSHWARCVSDQLQRTSIARRHVLSLRYFEAWRDITAVKELKVRRHIIKKGFGIWQKGRAIKSNDVSKSIAAYEANIIKKIFWAWLRSFCEREALAWWAIRTKHKTFSIWLYTYREHQVRKEDTISDYERRSKETMLLLWARKSEKHTTSQREATMRQVLMSCAKHLLKWRFESTLLRPERQLRTILDIGVKTETLKIWSLRAWQERQATTLYFSKRMRDAWITWIYKFRCRVLQSRGSERITIRALYQWVVKERLILGRRLMDRSLKQAGMQIMIRKSRLLIERESRDLCVAQAFAKRKLQKRRITHWRYRMCCHQNYNLVAINARSRQTSSDAFVKWVRQAQHVKQLQRWAGDGEFYFVASGTLKLWRSATETSKREKQRATYAQFRRKVKMHVASSVFLNWHHQVKAIMVQNDIVDSVRRNRSVIASLEIFDRWRAHTEEIGDLEAFRQQNMLKRTLNIWSVNFDGLQRHQLRARSWFEDRLEAQLLKKWSRNALQLRVQQYVVAELREKHGKRLSRKILAHWRHGRSQERQSGLSPGNAVAALNEHVGFERTERAEIWSEFGEEHSDDWVRNLNLTNVSHLPGYLSTPSKRATRAMTFMKLPSTTPSATLSAPAERYLRAQYSAGVLSPFRGISDSIVLKSKQRI
ncbi:MAG: hypothetical protein M1818_000851 [Claussenomyces sp. TS43310]|nr:MAG: hypothetical protein M1818_000851 [Claussenomyces sp. TS43310]